MAAKFICALLQTVMADKVPAFACWLFYSEMTIGLVLGLGALVYLRPEGLVALLYAAFCFCSAETYRKKRAEQRGETWAPSRLAIASAYFTQAGLGFVALLPLSFVESTENLVAMVFLTALGIGMLWWSGSGVWTLYRGGWPDWP